MSLSMCMGNLSQLSFIRLLRDKRWCWDSLILFTTCNIIARLFFTVVVIWYQGKDWKRQNEVYEAYVNPPRTWQIRYWTRNFLFMITYLDNLKWTKCFLIDTVFLVNQMLLISYKMSSFEKVSAFNCFRIF